MSVLRKFAGQTMIYGLSTIVSRLINFVLTPIFVHKFPANIYGVFTHLYSWAAMLNAILAFGMETTFFRYLHKHENNRKAVYANTFTTILLVSILFLLTLLAFSSSIATWLNNGIYHNDYKTYVWLFGFILVADALAIIPFASLRADERPIRFSIIKLVNILTVLGTNLIFLFAIPYLIEVSDGFARFAEPWYRPGWLGYVFIANLIASIFTLLLLLPELLRVRLQLDRKMVVDMIAYSFPVLVANISFIINEHIDKMLLPKLIPGERGQTDVGIYGAVSRIAVFLSVFVQAFRLGAEPFFFSYAKNENARRTYSRIMEYFIIAMVIVMVGITANIEWLKHFIRGGSPEQQAIYWSGLEVVPILLMGYVLLGVYMNLSIWYKLSDQTRFGLYISGMGALVTLALNFVLIPMYSYVAAAWVTVVAYGCMITLSYLWGQARYPIPYKVPKGLAYLLAAGLLSWIMFDVLDRHLVYSNILFLGFLVVITYVERQTISEATRSLGRRN